jgi:hypothetical protein
MSETSNVSSMLKELSERFQRWAQNVDKRNRSGEFGKYPWQKDYGLWPWQRRRK